MKYKEKLNNLLKEMCAHMNTEQKTQFIEDNFLITIDHYKILDDEACKAYYEMLAYSGLERHENYKLYNDNTYQVRTSYKGAVSFTIKGYNA